MWHLRAQVDRGQWSARVWPVVRRWGPWVPVFVLTLTILAVLPWRWLQPPTTAFMVLYGDDEARQSWTWTAYEDIAPDLAIAIVASEDQRFPHHFGLDLGAVREALSEDRSSVRGASTITQQVAKNLYLWGGRSLIRKGVEAYLAVAIEVLWPKRRILEMYLNIAQFGPSTFGVGAACPQFFGVPPSQMSPQRSALLAVVLPSPRRMSPTRPSAYMNERAAWVREQVRQLGGATYLAEL